MGDMETLNPKGAINGEEMWAIRSVIRDISETYKHFDMVNGFAPRDRIGYP